MTILTEKEIKSIKNATMVSTIPSDAIYLGSIADGIYGDWSYYIDIQNGIVIYYYVDLSMDLD